MDEDAVRRAERLMEERLRARDGAPTDGPVTAVDAEPGAPPPSDRAADLVRDLQRVAADFANYRKRNEAERAEFAKFAKADLIAKLLDVLDGYDRALANMPEELTGQPWVEGMWLVERKLRAILDAEGLQPVESLGQPFDPYVHQAVAYVESGEPEGTVIEEHQKAYRLHDRVIRPALVTVAKGRSDAGPPGTMGTK